MIRATYSIKVIKKSRQRKEERTIQQRNNINVSRETNNTSKGDKTMIMKESNKLKKETVKKIVERRIKKWGYNETVINISFATLKRHHNKLYSVYGIVTKNKDNDKTFYVYDVSIDMLSTIYMV